jgi:hypothetical protein
MKAMLLTDGDLEIYEDETWSFRHIEKVLGAPIAGVCNYGPAGMGTKLIAYLAAGEVVAEGVIPRRGLILRVTDGELVSLDMQDLITVATAHAILNTPALPPGALRAYLGQ